MGYMRHHAIVVSGWKDEAVQAAHDKAVEMLREAEVESPWAAGRYEALVSPILQGVTNGYSSFAIVPDGSKEWWVDSDSVEQARRDFIRWLRDADGYLSWVEVQFGDDERQTLVTAHSDDDDGDAEEPSSSGEQAREGEQ